MVRADGVGVDALALTLSVSDATKKLTAPSEGSTLEKER